ncbi:Oxo-4-hydroxy-4-carboxy-5-ureidoimidazoline decarboxylase [Coniochaeta sp. 2T2.1]|nr:Oxo-4-hydroxy-4-carboxy-5-ureidoimidazoline decarboxylase [Coniochaeta sp. 2T2.1]
MSSSRPLDPTATPFLPAITSLPTLSDEALTSTLDLLLEPSPDLHTLALPTMRSISFDSYDDLISTIRDILLALTQTLPSGFDPSSPSTTTDDDPKAPLLRILSAHPRLGEKKVDSALSRAEQANLRGGGGDSEGVLEQLKQLNEEYEQRFPGLRYVVFVNGRGRGEVMDDMRRRIDRGDYEEEEREGVRAMCDIARDRAGKLLGAAEGR